MSVSRFALTALAGLALGGVFAAPANAADLGGDCCADLEERVAELEATTVRKGNRKVSVTLYGQVNKAVMFWDDSVEGNAYVVDNNHSSSRFGFKGKAKIGHGWSAGYKIEVETDSDSASNEQDANDENQGGGISVRHSYMYIKSKTYGAVNIGHTSPATDDLTYKGQVSGTTSYNQADWHYNQDFRIRTAAGGNFSVGGEGVDFGNLCSDAFDSDGCFDSTSRNNVVRYDSPKIAGFQLKVAWGEDDLWDIGLYMKQKVGDFKVKANAGYRKTTDLDAAFGLEEDKFLASGGIMHKPTGLYVEGSYVYSEFDAPNGGGDPAAAVINSLDANAWWISAGIQQKWNSLGKTTIWGEYAESEDGFIGNCGNTKGTYKDGTTSCADLDTELTRWGVGVSQKIDAAAMELYVLYQKTDADVSVAGTKADIEDFDLVVTGAKIKF